MPTTKNLDRIDLAQRRLRKVLKASVVASARTLEQKISDAGPNPMRIDPHVLTDARKPLEESGEVIVRKAGGMNWYHLAETSTAAIDEKLQILEPLHAELSANGFVSRMGQTLEIASWRALRAQPELKVLGAYRDLDEHDDAKPFSKEEPPTIIGPRRCTGCLDFIALNSAGLLGGIEIKNVREWLYPNRDEVRHLLRKCVELDLVPVLIARRIPFVTFKLLNNCGAIVHQTYNQLFPLADADLASRAKEKTLLGYHDIRLGNAPDTRLQKFAAQLPSLISAQRMRFDEFKDLSQSFGDGRMKYKEFAARVRRRVQGTKEDNDWPEEGDELADELPE